MGSTWRRHLTAGPDGAWCVCVCRSCTIGSSHRSEGDPYDSNSANVLSASTESTSMCSAMGSAAAPVLPPAPFCLTMDSSESARCVASASPHGSGPALHPARGQPPPPPLNRVSAAKLSVAEDAKLVRAGGALLQVLMPVLSAAPGVCDAETRNMAVEACGHLCGLADPTVRLFVSSGGLQALVAESRQLDVSACTMVHIAELLGLLIRHGHAQDVFTADGGPMLGRMMTTPHSAEDRVLDVDAKLCALRLASDLLAHGTARQVCVYNIPVFYKISVWQISVCARSTCEPISGA